MKTSYLSIFGYAIFISTFYLASCESKPPVVVNVELKGVVQETGNLIKEGYKFYKSSKDSTKTDTSRVK
jgi:hypothetical protein